jgi:hypothetical protein
LKEKKEGEKKSSKKCGKVLFFLLPPHFIHLRLEAQVPD